MAATFDLFLTLTFLIAGIGLRIEKTRKSMKSEAGEEQMLLRLGLVRRHSLISGQGRLNGAHPVLTKGSKGKKIKITSSGG
ncbi:hypothetical protein B1A99_14430 [Cohnella sp. CIP 111063]|nr:hypothetical protein B1A99_14430 [Cohnella sp. CIP 111063]